MSKVVQRKNSPSFLQKFKDKKQVIDRDGLLKLLDMKRKQIQKSHEKTNNNQKQIFRIKKEKTSQPQANAQEKNDRQKSSGRNNYTNHYQRSNVKIKQSLYENQLIQKTPQKSVQLQKDLKLPKINQSNIILRGMQKNKSQSHISKQSISHPIKNHHEIETQISEISNTKSQRFELDKYAMNHLQLLNRFQRLLIDTRLSNGQKSILNTKTQ